MLNHKKINTLKYTTIIQAITNLVRNDKHDFQFLLDCGHDTFHIIKTCKHTLLTTHMYHYATIVSKNIHMPRLHMCNIIKENLPPFMMSMEKSFFFSLSTKVIITS